VFCWNFNWEVFTAGQMFTLTKSQDHWSALTFSSSSVFLR